MSAPRRLQLTDPAKQCPFCFETSLEAKRCKRCDLVWYCDHLCQAHHWPKHKLVCIPKEEQAKRKVANEALVSSSLRGHLIAVRDLLEKHKANVNYVSDKGFTALYLASSRDHPEVIAVLAAAGARLDWARSECGFTALCIASQEGSLKAVHSLIRANADPNQVMTNEQADSPLMIAAFNGHALIIDALAAAGARVDYARPKDGTTALYLASHFGKLQAVRSLVRASADPNQVMTNDSADSPLMIAAFNGHALVIDALAAAVARVDYARPKDGATAINIASQQGHLQAVHSLIRANADPNQVTTGDWADSALIYAAEQGHALVVDALVAAGARVDYARSKDGATALLAASQEGHLQAVSSLIRASADPNQVMTNDSADSPLMIAAQNGHALVIDALAAAGARVDYARPKDGATALFAASQFGYLQAVRSLLVAGADPRLAAHDDTTALDVAKRNKHTAIVALLEARLAELAASP